MKDTMKNKFLFLVIISLILTQCSLFEVEGDIEHIYKLSSPDNRIQIYTSYIESPMAFGSGNIEITALKTGEKYNPRRYGNLNGYVILGWIGNDTLKVLKFHYKEEKKDIKIPKSKLHEIKKYDDFFLDITHRTSYGGGLDWFSFDTLFFTRDSVIFIEFDSTGKMKDKLGLLKGQIRLSMKSDTVTKIYGEYYERIEDHFAKITKGNEYGYPYVVGEDCEISPKHLVKTSIFKNQPITEIIYNTK